MKHTTSLMIRLFIIFIAIAALFGARLSMSNQIIEVKWEWLSDRAIENKLLVKVEEVSKVSKGFFGIRASPSMADTLPEATDVIVSVVSGSEKLMGKTISVRMPGVEANKLKVGEYAAFALLNDDSICVCVSVVPKDMGAVNNWLENWNCK